MSNALQPGRHCIVCGKPGGSAVSSLGGYMHEGSCASKRRALVQSYSPHAPELVDALLRIYRASASGNNGAVMGEARLCPAFETLARDVLTACGVKL